MKSFEVLKRYAEGERNFRGAQLQQCDFRGQDLRGIDISGADIRGTNFSNANLSEASLRNVKAGLPSHYRILHGLVSLLVSVVLGTFAALSGVWMSSLLSVDYVQRFTILPALAVMTAFISVLTVIIATRDFSINLLLAILMVSSIVFSVVELSPVFAFTGLGAIAGYVLVLGIQSINLLLADRLMLLAIFSFGLSTTYSAFSLARIHTEIFALLIALSNLPISLYCAQVAAQGRHKFGMVLHLTLLLRTLGSTSFVGANLTGVDFSYAHLKNVNLWHATLTRVRWRHVRRLSQVHTNDANLKHPRLRSLLVSLNGYRQSFEGLNLRGIHLEGANLEQANLKRADLSDASLRGANLKHANLTKTLCVGTWFNQADFTGICLQEWNINHETNLTGVTCQYVFLRESPDCQGSRERRPHDPGKVFEPGDFEMLYQRVTATVQLLLRDGLDAASFQNALHHVMRHYPDTRLTGIERKGEQTLVTLSVAEADDKSQIEQLWDETYGARLEAVKTATLLEAEQRRAEEMKEITLTTVSKLGNVLSHLTIANTNTVVTETRAMVNSTDASRKVQIGHVEGDFQASDAALNLGNIKQSSVNTNTAIAPSSTAAPPAAFPETTLDLSVLDLCLQKLGAALEADDTIPAAERAAAVYATKALQQAVQQGDDIVYPANDPQRLQYRSALLRSVRILEHVSQTLPSNTSCARTLNLLLPLITVGLNL